MAKEVEDITQQWESRPLRLESKIAQDFGGLIKLNGEMIPNARSYVAIPAPAIDLANGTLNILEIWSRRT